MLGTNIINLRHTWEKLLLAARVIVSIENPADVAVITGKSFAQVSPPVMFDACYFQCNYQWLGVLWSRRQMCMDIQRYVATDVSRSKNNAAEIGGSTKTNAP